MSLQVLLTAAEGRLKASLAVFSASVGVNIGCTHLRLEPCEALSGHSNIDHLRYPELHSLETIIELRHA
jgi:hypothetical protein